MVMKLRISKSNFMLYDYCKYKFKKEFIDGERSPTTEVMLLGTEIHKYYENKIMGVEQIELTYPDDETNEIMYNIHNFEAQRKEILKPELYKPVICEQKFTKVIMVDDVEITMVGKPDAVFLEEDDTLNIMELKTGKWADYKKSKIRKELVFYAMLLDGQTDYPIENISWLYPKHDHFDTEPIKKQTRTAVMKQFSRMIESYKNDDFEASYHERKCESCVFLKHCIFR